MAINYTPALGLAKPTDVELANDWAENLQLCKDNNDIIKDAMNIVMTAYTPTFIGPSSNPNVGGGYVLGEYCRISGLVFGNFVVKCQNPGVSSGSGTGAFGIKLPFAADSVFHSVGNSLDNNPGTPSCVGEGHFNDSTDVSLSGSIALELIQVGPDTFVRPITETYTGKTIRWVGPGIPVSLGDSDSISGSFIYWAA